MKKGLSYNVGQTLFLTHQQISVRILVMTSLASSRRRGGSGGDYFASVTENAHEHAQNYTTDKHAAAPTYTLYVLRI